MNVSTSKYHLRACNANPGKAWLSIRPGVCNALSPQLIDAPSLAQIGNMPESEFDDWADEQFFGE